MYPNITTFPNMSWGPAVIFTEHVDGLEAWRRANAMKLGLGWSMKVSWAWPRRRDLLII